MPSEQDIKEEEVSGEEKIEEIVEDAATTIEQVESVIPKTRAPVIRVRLDDHFADVTIEDLVRRYPPLSSIQC